MELTVHGKHLDVGDALKGHMQDKLEEINEKYFGRAIEAIVTIGPEPHNFFRTHISLRGGQDILMQGTSTEGDPYASFDSAADKVAKQLRRYKTRLRDHHERLEQEPGELAPTLIRENVIEAFADHKEDELPAEKIAEPAIVAEMTRKIQKMTVSEAVMRMDLAGETAMLFKNSKTDGLNMIYMRSDGNIGWVDPQTTEMLAAE